MEKRSNVWPYLIMDGQWGSTGKGLIAGYLAMERCPDAVVCNFGPNAGHTFITPSGETVMTQQLPTGIVTPGPANIFIGPGAIIDPDLMTEELAKFAHFLRNKRIYIHPRAALVLPQHKVAEKASLGRISSTQKGTGAAVAAKVMREVIAVVGGPYRDALPWGNLIVSEQEYTARLMASKVLQIESAQGFELGLNQGFDYPHCTSRDVTPAQILSDCGLPHWLNPEVIVTLRTFPIRVGHQYDGAGVKVGDSGPIYPDQTELTWGEGPLANMAPERTTVTQKIRRIFTFSDLGFRRMCEFVRPTSIFLNFTNYLDDVPEFTSPGTFALIQRINSIHSDITGVETEAVRWIGTGPSYADVKKRF